MYHWTFKFKVFVILQLWTILSIFVSSTFGKDLNYTIKEETNSNHLIGNIRDDFNLKSYLTSDEDYDNLKYSILSQGNTYAKYFNINERTSSLFTKENIDREKLEHCKYISDCDLSVDVIAKANVGTFFKKIKVKIFIKDINDNVPEFPTNVTKLEFSEDSIPGYTKRLDGAVDDDSGINSVKEYKIKETNVPFSVDFEKLVDGSSSVKVRVDKSLDSETNNFYQIHILAIDGGETPYTGTVMVNITITDENDNAPIFMQPMYNITVKETSPIGTEILRVTATDKDSGNNGKVFYRLSPHQKEVIRSIFAINDTSGSLSLLKELVYEPGEIYHVIVEASDSASKPLFSQASVFVTVLDSGNDAPEININLLSNDVVAKISENAKTGAAVAHLDVIDDDLGDNGKVTCRVIKSYFFELQSYRTDEYKVVVVKPLNRETIEQHDVTVLCQDSGTPSLNSSVTFVVKVLDENDQTPRFSKPLYQPEIVENNPIDASVFTVSATDFDIGINSELIYSLNETNGYNFSIDPELGTIYVNSVLDREAISNLTFKVIAKDKGKPPNTGTSIVRLTILDENDNLPVFTKTIYTFNIIENLNSGILIGEVLANDPDFGENGTVEYMLSPTEVTSNLPFVVMQNGSIYTTQVLDREVAPHGYNFNVRAFDRGKPSLHNVAHVTVFIQDVNDNKPVILYPAYDNKTVKIAFDISPDLPFAKVSAEDADSNFNAKLVYTIENESMRNFFRIDTNSGDIYLARPLTKKDMKTYTFTIVVEDQGTPRKSSKQNLTVIVTTPDIIDTPPGEETQGYLVIVIIIICVTVVLSVTIILVICIIRKVDIKGKNKKHVHKENGTVNGGDMYDAITRNTEREKREPAEKKVSFSIDSHPAVCLSANPDNKISEKDLAVEEILDRIMPPEKPNQISKAAKKHNGYHQQQSTATPTAARLQQHQHYLQQQEKNWGAHNLEVQYKKQDDNHSETSGETTASDSGRGGSESDIQSSGGLSHCLDLDYLKNMYSPTNSPGKHKPVKQPDIHSDPVHQQIHNHHPIHYKHVYSRHSDTRTAHGSHSPSSQINNALFLHKGGVNPKDYRGRNGVHWKGITDMLNNSMATIEDYDEDDNTTTSGSYTVDEQDIRSELSVGMDCIV